jgi:hypothetical protein
MVIINPNISLILDNFQYFTPKRFSLIFKEVCFDSEENKLMQNDQLISYCFAKSEAYNFYTLLL